MDLNSDIGELEGEDGRRLDAIILNAVTSCNIACGGHAGDQTIMQKTVREAIRQNVLIGAHPSYPDRENFGRKALDIGLNTLEASLNEQVGRLKEIVDSEGGSITHLKAHGALYNSAARQADLANLICKCARSFEIENVFGLPDSEVSNAASRFELNFIPEGFVDRAYETDGSLSPRDLEGAVHTDAGTVLNQALGLANKNQVKTRVGEIIPLRVGTLCLHGDTKGASDLAIKIKDYLVSNGVRVAGYV